VVVALSRSAGRLGRLAEVELVVTDRDLEPILSARLPGTPIAEVVLEHVVIEPVFESSIVPSEDRGPLRPAERVRDFMSRRSLDTPHVQAVGRS